MNSTTANTAAGSGLTVQQPLTRATTLATLMRREFWEHPALWRAPAIVAALLGISTLFSMTINVDGGHVPHLQDPDRIAVLNITQDVWAGLIYLVASIVVTFYVLDALYAERKDRSILFWKSLPVSDGLTVASKFLMVTVVVPLVVFVLATASHLVALLIWKLRVHADVPDVVVWDTTAWLRGEAFIILCLILSSLWYAPLVAAGLLLSAWVKRNPVLWATLLVLVPPVLEYMFFRTSYLWRFINYRSAGIWSALGTRDGHSLLRGDMHMLTDLNWAGAFTNANLWLGLVAAAAMLFAAARVRRYRDDTAG